MSSADPEREFLTIVTFGRSGSTALQAALNAHPHTIIRGENYNALRGLHAYIDAVAAAADIAVGHARAWARSRERAWEPVRG